MGEMATPIFSVNEVRLGGEVTFTGVQVDCEDGTAVVFGLSTSGNRRSELVVRCGKKLDEYALRHMRKGDTVYVVGYLSELEIDAKGEGKARGLIATATSLTKLQSAPGPAREDERGAEPAQRQEPKNPQAQTRATIEEAAPIKGMMLATSDAMTGLQEPEEIYEIAGPPF